MQQTPKSKMMVYPYILAVDVSGFTVYMDAEPVSMNAPPKTHQDI
jgi:hypothetical protein